MAKVAKMNGKKNIKKENGSTGEKKKIKEENGTTGDSNSPPIAGASGGLLPCEIDGCERKFARLAQVKTHMRRFHKDSVHACTWKDKHGKECSSVFKHRSVIISY